ncbi:MAG: Ham1 family protein [Parcubacteria group bacterium GW2011_GWC1_45_13]|uniref:Ham1 family protein n=3 Tax=Patescibacteria group TaxID=1783273 RepID=A0A0G1IYM7_9BACT|nr:MAG: Ham1 family protein [Candidatus Giovannonibacteria bacterium GW2011_GWB1_44_23]KKT64125.1 MAG: Ham1 family protein [Candidatus Giovannonibacteria bacterium GW2011_GWA1_44_29]KKT91725.1 MAG: Ham1 family protein [Parcubacteria group bacterium GW2011_GWC1_45_13]
MQKPFSLITNMSLYFITGNKNKFEEVKAILGDVEQLDIDLPEIQDIDAKNIIRAKLLEALNYKEGKFIVEDTSLYLDCLKSLPGPLIKWFLKTIENNGLANMAEKLGNNRAEAKTIIGYAKNRDEIEFFEGSIFGKIVAQTGVSGFGWDPIFQPDGFDKTFAEMTTEEKNNVSMRKIALEKLKEFAAKEQNQL